MKQFKLTSNHQLAKFITRTIASLIFITLFWIVVIFYFYEHESSKKASQYVEHEKSIVQQKIKEMSLSKSEIKNILDKQIEASMKKRGGVGIRIIRKGEMIIDKIDNTVPKKLQEKFNKVFSLDTNVKSGLLIPGPNEELYLLLKIEDRNSKIQILFKLSEESKKHLEKDIKETLIIAIISILFSNLLMFPIFYGQYKKLIINKKELLQSNLGTLKALGNAVSKRDSDTDEHNYRVTFYSVKLAEKLQLDSEIVKGLIKGAFLHDVGKICIQDAILLKPGKLTAEEFEIMKTHVLLGVEILSGITWLESAKKVIECHHEKYDGTGYPYGLRGEDIPIEARVFAVADVFDALTSKRPYKEPFSVEKSMEILKDGKNSHFDGKIVDVFIEIGEELHRDTADKNKASLESVLLETVNHYYSF